VSKKSYQLSAVSYQLEQRFISRRGFFRSVAVLPAIAGFAARRLKVVVTGGHPGDPEYGCGGTIARYADLGHDVVLLYLNRGEKGCPEENPAKGSAVRIAEARKACEILKARPVFAAQCDGHAIVDADRYDEFRALLAAERPDVLFAHWPIDGHRDHRAISMLAYDAWLKMGKTFGFYYYEVSDGEDTLMFTPTDYVDISKTEARKRAACYAHASQSPDKFYALQSSVTRFRGIEAGYGQAEGFVRHVESSNAWLP
jgi:LmbE family N-acetylglucosaminyl deacetylase